MNKLVWEPSFSVNISEIDLQHQTLMEMINDLNDAIQEQKDGALLGKIVSGLIHYAETHFKTEEKYFKEFGYPDAENHLKEHASFVQKVSDFIDELDMGKQNLSWDVSAFLGDWLKDHIKGVDNQYSQFLTEKGVN